MDFIIQAYGREDIIQQAIICAVSLLKQNRQSQIHFATDQVRRLADYFAGFDGVKVHELNNELLKKFRGEINFVHRVKLEVILWISEKEKLSHSKIIYLDGDTIIQYSDKNFSDRISDNQSLMHVRESQLKKPQDLLTKKIAKFCKKNQDLGIDSEVWMWNAGVIGITSKNLNLIEKAKELTDLAYKKYPKHVIEQLAVSFYLQKNTQVMGSDDFVLHYWQHKEIWQNRIQDFLSKHQNAEQAILGWQLFDQTKILPAAHKNIFQKIFDKILS